MPHLSSKSGYELYADCSELPLYNWVKLACTGSLTWLIKTGICSDGGILQQRYELITGEYGTLIKDTKATQELKLKIQLTQLANKIDQVNVAVHALRTLGRDENIIAILRSPIPIGLGFGRLSYVNLEHDLKLTESYLQMDVVRFKQRSGEMATLVEKAASKGSGSSEGEFYSEIASLSKWIDFGIAPRDTSVMQYISYLNMLKLEIKNNEK